MHEPALWIKFLTDLASQGLAALAGAGGGAWLAFAFARKQAQEDRRRLDERDNQRERDREALAGQVAMLTLARMYNTLLNFFRQRIEPWRTEPLQWYFSPPGGEPSLEDIRIDYGSLAFLLKGDAPSIVLKLDLLVEHYRSVADMVRRRSELHETAVLPKLEGVSVVPGTPESALRPYIGPILIATMRSYTDDIRGLVYTALDQLPTVGQELYTLLKKRMPDENFIWFTRATDRDGNPVPADGMK